MEKAVVMSEKLGTLVKEGHTDVGIGIFISKACNDCTMNNLINQRVIMKIRKKRKKEMQDRKLFAPYSIFNSHLANIQN